MPGRHARELGRRWAGQRSDPRSWRSDFPTIAPGALTPPGTSSLTNRTATLIGSTSGTPSGRKPFVPSTLCTSTFARDFGLGKSGIQRKSSGARSSVTLTSRNFVSHGVPSELSSVDRPSDLRTASSSRCSGPSAGHPFARVGGCTSTRCEGCPPSTRGPVARC